MKRPWFELVEPKTGEAPVVVEVPHAGLFLPAEVLSNLVAPARAIARDADLFVDELYEDAPAEGATLLVAHTSRYVVDLNRAEDDVDSGVVTGDPRPARPHARGLLWRTTTDDEPALLRPLSRDEYHFRLQHVHRPYHETLRAVLDRKIARFGYAILLCAHSMPSVGRAGHADAGVPRADVVPGSRGRTSAHRRVIDAIDSVAIAHGRSVEHDRPYRGGFSTSHYGRPAQKCHAIQVELARRLYLDESTLQRTPGLQTTRKLCRAFVARLASLPSDALT
ncbi:MAG: N-formylglutamate amidohydrolase [Sandaracinaceae bacterium]|nr:N-formylglutamate amidohydrolase [Sandaracinaceae bacterium]